MFAENKPMHTSYFHFMLTYDGTAGNNTVNTVTET